ncbi:MAG: hypothetical protein LBU66_08640 [Treponema sp.]|nr:hypothetical protein [Treponema sp.]
MSGIKTTAQESKANTAEFLARSKNPLHIEGLPAGLLFFKSPHPRPEAAS